MRPGERQVAPTIDGIRRDHVARYEWAASHAPKRNRILDLGCGVGYGARLLSDAGFPVWAVDSDGEAIAYARAHYNPRGIIVIEEDDALRFVERYASPMAWPVVTCFEVIEHLADPLPMLAHLARTAGMLFASVPNETVFPFRSEANAHQGYAYHHRHYTRDEFEDLLRQAGWTVDSWWGQAGPQSPVEPNVDGRTLLAIARPSSAVTAAAVSPSPVPAPVAPPTAPAIFVREAPLALPGRPLPKHVAILGLGPSLDAFVDLVKRAGGREAFCDEVWAVNAVAGVLQHDRVFHMDDVRVQEARAKARPASNIAVMLAWLKRHPGPIYTSQPHPDYPGTVSFPLEEVVNLIGTPYLNSTLAYAVAFAVLLGTVDRISLFGVDFTYPNAHQAERGRACAEFWLGFARGRGIKVGAPDNSSLFDACEPPHLRTYGYDGVDLAIEPNDAEKRLTVRMTPRAALPSAAEIEARYDHTRSPVPQHLRGR